MNDMLKIARIYDARTLPICVLLDVVRVADRVALSLTDRTTRTLRWWPWSNMPAMDEVLDVADVCDDAAEDETFGTNARALLRVLVFHRLYGGPVAEQLNHLLPVELDDTLVEPEDTLLEPDFPPLAPAGGTHLALVA